MKLRRSILACGILSLLVFPRFTFLVSCQVTSSAQTKPLAQTKPPSGDVVSKSVSERLKPGIVVEKLEKNFEGEKAGLQEGDLLLSWSRDNVKGRIWSPFDLLGIEIEQAPRGNVTLEGFRGAEERVWELGPDDWGIKARPNLPQNLLAIYLEGQELAKAGKVNEAEKRWRTAAVEAQKYSATWLGAWLCFHSAEQLANVQQWKDADDSYQKAVQAVGISQTVAAQLLRAWAISYERRGDLPNAGKYYQQAVTESQKSGTEILFTAASLENLCSFFRQRSELPKAEEYCQEALTIQQKLAPGSLSVAHTLATFGLIATSRGNLASAENYEQQALVIQEKLAPGGLNVASTLFYLGVVSYYQGELERAGQYHQQALAIQQKLAPGSLDFSATLNNLGLALFAQGE